MPIRLFHYYYYFLFVFDCLWQADVDNSRIVQHYQLHTWAENKAPESGSCIVDLLEQVVRAQRQSGNAAFVVHCK